MIRLYRVSQAPGVRHCRVDHAAREVSDGASVMNVAMADADHRQHVASADGLWRTQHPAQTLFGRTEHARPVH